MSASEQDEYLLGLQRMANQIAANVAGLEAARAARFVADHLQRFWDPSMRRDLAEAVSEGKVAVSDTVRDALNDRAVGAD